MSRKRNEFCRDVDCDKKLLKVSEDQFPLSEKFLCIWFQLSQVLFFI